MATPSANALLDSLAAQMEKAGMPLTLSRCYCHEAACAECYARDIPVARDYLANTFKGAGAPAKIAAIPDSEIVMIATRIAGMFGEKFFDYVR